MKIISSSYLLCIVCCMFLTCLTEVVHAKTDKQKYRYVINISLTRKPQKPNLPTLAKKYKIYNIKVKINNKIQYRSRMGFFSNKKTAERVLVNLKQQYKSAWLDTIKQYDTPYLNAWLKRHGTSSKNTAGQPTFMLNEKETAEVMEKARQSVVNQDYSSAIKLYTKVLSRGDIKYRQDAQEYLGVTREKNGQYAHAKAEYQEYLRLYPKGEGAERVKMRLNGMLTALKAPRRKLKKSARTERTVWESYGYLTEFYRYDRLRQNETVSERTSSTTTMGLFARRRSNSSNIKMQMTGDYLYDFKDTEDNRRRLTSLYIDYANRPQTTSVRIGRQTHSRSGVLGRMDGIWADYQFHPAWKFNVVAGHPVNLIDTNKMQDNRTFYGYSLDIGTFNKYWDFNIFQIQQEVDGVTDREAVGGEIRYIHPEYIYFTLVDYDTYFEELNKFYLVSTWRFKNQTTLNLTFDKSKAPYMLTTNALQGQPFLTIEEMRSSFTDEEIKQIARDRTAESTIATVSGTVPISRSYALNLDLTVYNLSGTPESAGVQRTESTGNEFFYGIQLIGNDVILKNDTLIAGVRYSDSSAYNRTGFSASERLVLQKKWRTNLSMYYEMEERTNGAESTTIRPSLGVDYIYSRSLRLEGDFIYDRTSRKGDTLPTDEEGLNIGFGIVYDF